jgi:ATP-binding cassette subfamily C protein CydCD
MLTPLALVDVFMPLADAGAISQRVSASTRRLDELAHRTPAVTDPVLPQALSGSSHVSINHVCAGWSDTPALEDLSLEIADGSHIAVIGPSGCGKSTMAALVARFIDPASGDVRLGGRLLPDAALADVRSRVGVVDDAPYVFATSVAQNLRIGRRDATDADMLHALESVGLDTWLDGLPHGLDSLVGEGGPDLSGGERARLALARALLADRAVLVLDEPTAHLDEVTAERTMDAVLRANRGRSLVWITHTELGLDRMDEVVDLGRPADDIRGRGDSARADEEFVLELSP